jgi:integrase
VYPLLLCAFRTGMRLGELLGLACEDVNFPANTIEIRRAFSHGRLSTPKSHKSRVVDMSDQLGATLRDQRERLRLRFGGTLLATNVPGTRTPEAVVQLVFPSDTGGPLDGDNFRHRVFYPLLEEADVPRARFHDIRHTFASLLLQQGESLHYVREQMGHASIQTTVDVYEHLVPGSNRNAVNRLDDPDVPTLKVLPADAG